MGNSDSLKGNHVAVVREHCSDTLEPLYISKDLGKDEYEHFFGESVMKEFRNVLVYTNKTKDQKKDDDPGEKDQDFPMRLHDIKICGFHEQTSKCRLVCS